MTNFNFGLIVSVELQDKVMQIDNSPPISSHKKAEEKNETESKPPNRIQSKGLLFKR